MNYTRIYNQLITRGKQRVLDDDVYRERHHIIPRCRGGSDENDNLVELTAREHFIAHLLLWKMYPYDIKLAHAARFMVYMRGVKINSKIHENIKKKAKHTDESRRKISQANKGKASHNKGKTHSDETRRKISEAQKGNTHMLGKRHSKETRRKMSESKKGKTSHNKGTKQTPELVAKRRESRMKKSGYIVSDETRRKMREAWVRRKLL